MAPQIRFADELKRWGPDSAAEPPCPADADAYCRTLARSHHENFAVVSWLLPRRLHRHFYSVYAYCRWADDLADEVGDSERSLVLLAWWRSLLDATYDAVDAGSDTAVVHHPVFVALAGTIVECGIPRGPFADLISAFEQDQHVVRYESFEELADYCRRSANPVGRLVLYVVGRFTDENAALSDSICTGLQLANFWQDVARDFDLGRVYLPAEDRRRFGYSDEDLRRQAATPEFVALMQFQIDRARRMLEAGRPLIERMPGRVQIDVEMFLGGGLKILDRIEAIGCRVWEQRPVVRKRDAASLLLRCAGRWLLRRCGLRSRARPIDAAPVQETQSVP